MPVGDCQREFGEAAAADGIALTPAPRFAWLCERGHLELRDVAVETADALEQIYTSLGGDPAVLATARTSPLRGDYLHEPTATLVEIDEIQHFTSARLLALDAYPRDAAVGFDIDRYKELCHRHRAKADKYRAAKAARGFGPGGRIRQRAYYDALRDLAAPAMGHPPLVRIAAPDGSGVAAYRAHREGLLSALS